MQKTLPCKFHATPQNFAEPSSQLIDDTVKSLYNKIKRLYKRAKAFAMRKNPTMTPASKRNPRQPFVGALLRMAYQITREYQLEVLREHGFGDLNQALLNVMVYPHPDGVRPGDLAERTNMTRQATNYSLGQLEALGYIERRAQKGSTRRLVFLTRRGWQSIDRHRAAVLELEAQWAKVIGPKRFNDFKETLAQLIALKLPGEPDRA